LPKPNLPIFDKLVQNAILTRNGNKCFKLYYKIFKKRQFYRYSSLWIPSFHSKLQKYSISQFEPKFGELLALEYYLLGVTVLVNSCQENVDPCGKISFCDTLHSLSVTL